ncbi:hypothetical protein P879_11014, partial [Paragonimus westermani]
MEPSVVLRLSNEDEVSNVKQLANKLAKTTVGQGDVGRAVLKVPK